MIVVMLEANFVLITVLDVYVSFNNDFSEISLDGTIG